MAVIRVAEDHTQRRSQVRQTGFDSIGLPEYTATHTRAFKVKTNDIRDGTAVAMTAFDIPTPGEAHDHDADAYVVGVSADPVDDSGTHFLVRIDYSDEVNRGGQADTFTPPLSRPWEVRWGGAESSEPYFVDAEDKPVVNSAGERFAAMLERETSELAITITRNEADGVPGDDESYSNTVNTNDVLIGDTVFVAGTLKLSPIQAELRRESYSTTDYVYWRKTYTFKARRQGWRHEVNDEGYHEKDTAVGYDEGTPIEVQTLRPIRDEEGTRIDSPWPLNGEGKKLASFDADRFVLEFHPYEEISWSSRGFTVPA